VTRTNCHPAFFRARMMSVELTGQSIHHKRCKTRELRLNSARSVTRTHRESSPSPVRDKLHRRPARSALRDPPVRAKARRLRAPARAQAKPSTHGPCSATSAQKSTLTPATTTCRRNRTPSWQSLSLAHSTRSGSDGATRMQCACAASLTCWCCDVMAMCGHGAPRVRRGAGRSHPSARSVTRAHPESSPSTARGAERARSREARPHAGREEQ
jgi:hypothetical protein